MTKKAKPKKGAHKKAKRTVAKRKALAKKILKKKSHKKKAVSKQRVDQGGDVKRVQDVTKALETKGEDVVKTGVVFAMAGVAAQSAADRVLEEHAVSGEEHGVPKHDDEETDDE